MSEVLLFRNKLDKVYQILREKKQINSGELNFNKIKVQIHPVTGTTLYINFFNNNYPITHAWTLSGMFPSKKFTFDLKSARYPNWSSFDTEFAFLNWIKRNNCKLKTILDSMAYHLI